MAAFCSFSLAGDHIFCQDGGSLSSPRFRALVLDRPSCRFATRLLFNLRLLCHTTFRIFKVSLSRSNIIKVYVASKFTDVALPIATLGKVAVFVRNGRRQGVPSLNMGIGIFFVLLAEIVSFIILSFFSLIILYAAGQPRTYLLVSLLVLTVFALLVILFLIRLAVLRKAPSRFVLLIIRWISRLARQGKIEYQELEKIFLELGSDLKAGSDKLWLVLGLSLGTHILNLITFAFVYLAFVNNIDPLTILSGYIAGWLFTVVSITPQGVGVAETIMIATLHSFGLDLSTAAVITLAYRGLLYWLPLFAGFYFFSHLELSKEERR